MMVMKHTCCNEHISDVLILNIIHLEAEEVHHAREVVLVRHPGHHLNIQVSPGELPGVDVVDHLLHGFLVHLLDEDLAFSLLDCSS